MSCESCAALAAENAHLRRQVGELTGGIQSTLGFIDAELDEPTMPRRDFIPAIQVRLGAVLTSAC